MIQKATARVPVFLFLIDEKDRIYLQRRYQTGFLDGYYEPPAGGLHNQEFPQDAACREALEEAGATVDRNDIELFHAYLNFNSDPNPYLGLMFRTRIWQGTPSIMEPHLCDDAGFYELNNLPELLPQVRDALKYLSSSDSIHVSDYEILK